MNILIALNTPIVILITVLLISAIIDFKIQRIPNALTLPSILTALVYHSIINGTSGFTFSIIGVSVGIGLLIAPYLMGGMGAGDAKLMGVVGAFVGAKGVFISFLFTAIAGGLYALLVLLIKRRYFDGFLRDKFEMVKSFILTRQYIPNGQSKSVERPRLCYGLAIALGSITYIILDLTGYQLPI